MKVALVYDRVNKWGGAERVLLAFHKLFPDAPLFTSVYNMRTAPWAEIFNVRTSFLQRIPKANTSHEIFSSLMPLAFESFNFDEYDVVISFTSEAAKGIITKPKTLHICYCLTPTRYLWSSYDDYFRNPVFRFVTIPIILYLKTWDRIAAQRPDYMIAISKEVQGRIKEYYDRDSEVIYPPVSTFFARGPAAATPTPVKQASSFASAQSAPHLTSSRSLQALDGGPPLRVTPRSKVNHESTNQLINNYFLVVSRLVPYKRVDIAIEACNRAALPLKIVGRGWERKKLESIAGSTVEFLDDLTDGELSHYYKSARALICPGVEDFGLAVAEAQSHGIPIIAYKGGGAKEIVIEGKTGEFFQHQDAESLIGVLENFDERRYNGQDCIENGERFSQVRFEKEFITFFDRLVKEYFNKRNMFVK